MSIEFAKAYKNFQKFEEEREQRDTPVAPASKGLLSPRGGSSRMQSQGTTELDKVADYVQQIRKHRMKIRNDQ